MQTNAELRQKCVRPEIHPARLGLLHCGTLTELDRNAVRIAEFLGLEVELLAVKSHADLANYDRFRGVIASAETLNAVALRDGDSTQIRSAMHKLSSEIFIFGFHKDGRHDVLLQNLTSGRLRKVKQPGSADALFRVPVQARHFCSQFAGLTVGHANPVWDRVFDGAGSGCSPLIELGEKAFVVRLNSPAGRVTLCACEELADLDQPVEKEVSLLKFFSRLVPLMMFLREAFAGFVWENSRPTACLIIDDPLLRESYGFLNYRRLLKDMADTRFSTSIAMIPYNFKRTSRAVAELFLSNPERLSVCIHGCDHTAGEFGSTNATVLAQQAGTALQRMGLHQERTGVPFDCVMVFPQGIFSGNAAMEALKCCGYTAAINSTQFPIDQREPIFLRELLNVTVNRFADFPLFVRRYPDSVAQIAFDLFLGKPALLVEHHGYFRNGFSPLRQTVETINAMDRRLKWMSVEKACSNTSLMRRAGNDAIEVRFFCDRLHFQNDCDRAQRFLLRPTRSTASAQSVTVNDQPTRPLFKEGQMSLECLIMPGQWANIRICRNHVPGRVGGRQKLTYRAGVFFRRSLSEFRDNYLDKSRTLTRAQKALRRAVTNRNSLQER